jgi:hypothetical protein
MIWKQTSNPTTASDDDPVTGYEAISIPAGQDNKSWGGLQKTSETETLLRGSIEGGSWFFAVGATELIWQAIPGPNVGADYGSIVTQTELYVWVPSDPVYTDEVGTYIDEFTTVNGAITAGNTVKNPYTRDFHGDHAHSADLYTGSADLGSSLNDLRTKHFPLLSKNGKYGFLAPVALYF